jgi:hypothetical protein
MSTLRPTTRTTSDDARPVPTTLVSAAFGFVVFALAMLSGEIFELNADQHPSPADEPFLDSLHLPEMAIGLIGAAIAVLLASRALSGGTARIDRYAVALAAVAAITFPVFWAGWPTIFGAVAVGLAIEQRRRVGSLSGLGIVAVVLGSVAFVAGTVTCVFG